MRVALQSLYETLLVGSSPCHGFTKVPGQTGGFYHIVCRHGVSIYMSKSTLFPSFIAQKILLSPRAGIEPATS
jgi:hypothetical protein